MSLVLNLELSLLRQSSPTWIIMSRNPETQPLLSSPSQRSRTTYTGPPGPNSTGSDENEDELRDVDDLPLEKRPITPLPWKQLMVICFIRVSPAGDMEGECEEGIGGRNADDRMCLIWFGFGCGSLIRSRVACGTDLFHCGE